MITIEGVPYQLLRSRVDLRSLVQNKKCFLNMRIQPLICRATGCGKTEFALTLK